MRKNLYIKYFALLFVTLLSFSCSIGKEGVYYNEMSIVPKLHLGNQLVIVETANSVKNSALQVYKLDFAMDTTRKLITIKGYQSVTKTQINRFEFQAAGKSKLELQQFDYYWIDPNSDRTKLEIIESF